MPRESNLEVKVGLFVVAALVCLVAFVFSISGFAAFKKGQDYRVMFQYANGLKKGAPVRVAGVDAGHVRGIKVLYGSPAAPERTTQVLVDIWLDQDFIVAADSKFLINQLGLLGEKYLEILPGVSPVAAVPGSTVRGEDPVSMEEITRMLGTLGPKVGAVLDSINGGVLSDANKAALAAVLANISVLTAGLKDGKGTVGKLLTDPGVYDNLDEMTADLKLNPWKLFYRPKGK